MRRYWAVAGGILGFFLALYLLVEALGVPLLTDPSSSLQRGDVLAALMGVGLLVLDSLLPVPSSLVMIAHGALFGVVFGALLSLVGRLGFALVAFGIGRRGGPLLARLVTPTERARADALLARWGLLAIVLTRPVPLLAETAAVLAGASRLAWGPFAVAVLAGSLPEAVIYALAGSVAATFQNAALVFAFVLVVAVAFWVALRQVEPRLEAHPDPVKTA